jgi:hypothetical protein
MRGTAPDGRLGTGLAAPGDITGDGRPDLAVGAPRFDGGALDTGLVLIARP